MAKKPFHQFFEDIEYGNCRAFAIGTDEIHLDFLDLGSLGRQQAYFLELKKDGNYPLHFYTRSSVDLHVLKGEGRIMIPSAQNPSEHYSPGYFLHIPKRVAHGFSVEKPTLMLYVCQPYIAGSVDLRHLKIT